MGLYGCGCINAVLWMWLFGRNFFGRDYMGRALLDAVICRPNKLYTSHELHPRWHEPNLTRGTWYFRESARDLFVFLLFRDLFTFLGCFCGFGGMFLVKCTIVWNNTPLDLMHKLLYIYQQLALKSMPRYPYSENTKTFLPFL